MRIFKLKSFAKFADKERLCDDKLRAVVEEVEAGIIHADLGGNVIKQRIARDGQGKRGSYRVVLLYKVGKLAFFVHGFAKSKEDNISKAQEDKFKELAKIFLDLTKTELDKLLVTKKFTEIQNEKKE
ncbi:toxin-antitoxin system, toxin component, RelE family [Bartonella australis AUST/NH1]|uniref:Toxin-antitoxin system, toxin component, RelE family n=1 Tax=Bartonella australis (strain Aust/NH1) TaxID=1094489 RepID=M1PBW4_BARAA|nr:type II toxin-antitoxin system RelE/ParE family toxin [Bartonella australis]AGF74126.1 toxin-antitoxin system, toxin component, RelE family [Bartonella australis AUST/NH1]